MRNKIITAAAVLFLGAALSAYAEFGIGAQFGGGTLNYGPSLLISPKEDFHLAFDWNVKNEGFSVAANGDLWVVKLPIASLGPGELSFFAGPGLYASVGQWNDKFHIGAGLRVPLGVNYRIQAAEIFLQGVPLIGVGFIPTFYFGDFGITGNIGFRFWI